MAKENEGILLKILTNPLNVTTLGASCKVKLISLNKL
jgi:hypothetical protein